MFHKFIVFASLIACVFLASLSSVSASNLTDWEQESDAIQAQREQIKKQLTQSTDKEKIALTIKDNKLAGYQTAYDKAIEYVQSDSADSEIQSTESFSFSNTTLRPGQVVPTEYIPYYKQAGDKYGIDWTVLAAIHDIETNFSTLKVMVSSVGAIGHMQFMPSTFAIYGVDGDGDGKRSAYSLIDSIYSAANYLYRSGYKNDVRKAIWNYNHADWYVNEVLETAQRIKKS